MKCYVELCLTKTFHLAYFSNFTNPHKSDKSVIDVTIVKWGFIIYSTLEILISSEEKKDSISSEEKKDSEAIITQQKEPKLKFISEYFLLSCGLFMVKNNVTGLETIEIRN